MNVRKAIDYGKLFEAVDRAVSAALPQMELYREIGRLICERPEKGAATAVAEHLQSAYLTPAASPRAMCVECGISALLMKSLLI